jgi:hypothetical protein
VRFFFDNPYSQKFLDRIKNTIHFVTFDMKLIVFFILFHFCSCTLDAMPNVCDKDNWGMPLQEQSKPFNYYEKVIRLPCSLQWKANEGPMSEKLETATAIHSKNTYDYNGYVSTDWIPENKELYSRYGFWGRRYDYNTFPPKQIKAATCQIDNTIDNSKWDITRIGPFRTTGNYDWLQLGWDNLWDTKALLKKHNNGIYIIGQFFSPVYENGTRISFPPIHIHHMHVGPVPYVRQRTSQFACAVYNTSCFNPHRILESHGDYNCVSKDGGLDCRVESFAER